MKEKLTRNLGLKLISLFGAFFVWLAVVNVANPSVVDTREVTVEITNKGILERSNLTYEIVGKKTAVISYKIKTKDAYRIKASDFRAYADLSEMYDVTGAIPVKVEVLKNEELFQQAPTVNTPGVIKIKTEKLQTKRFELQSNFFGTPSEGYVPGQVTLSPDYVYVNGPESLIGYINSVGIEFGIEGAVADVSGTAPVVFYDTNGNEVELGESVKALGGDISYTMQILKVKNLPLDFVVTGEVQDGYRYTGIECSVSSVPVAGLKSALASIGNVTIQSPELSIEGATADKTCELDLQQFIDPNVQIAGMEDTKITVTLKVEPLREKTYGVKAADITLTGRADDYNYEIMDGAMSIKVRGLKEDLDSLSTGKMNISVDVAGLTPGNHAVRAGLLLDDAYEVTEYPMCQIVVTVKSDSEISQSAEETKQPESEKTDETVRPTEAAKPTEAVKASETVKAPEIAKASTAAEETSAE